MKKPHQYRDLSREQHEELFSNYLVDSWSYSKVESFARNEKAFEMNYIYREPMKMSATTIGGSAYHKALEFYFFEYKQGILNDIVTLQTIAFEEINSTPANKWKIQKTTPTIEDCIDKANKIACALLDNFFKEIDVYTGDLEEVLDVEVYFNEFSSVNGVDIPLPCHGKIDLPIRTKSGKVVVIDHKSKTAFSDEKELKFSIGKQAITYVIGYEAKTGITADEVWFIENKSSINKDKSPQISCFKMEITPDVRRLYEALLYEPLKRMLEATSNPNYTYLINEADNYVDKAELYDFWAKTMVAEVEEFNIELSKKDLITQRLRKIRDVSLGTINPKIIKEFRKYASEFIQFDLTNKDMTAQQKIEHSLRVLSIPVKVSHKIEGYSSDTFLIEVSSGTSIASVYRYKLDIANALNVSSIRMMKDLFIYEGKSYLAVESPKQREKTLSFDPTLLKGMKIPIGIDNFGGTVFWDLDNPSTPHMLMCGSTGSGKSVCLISTLEYALAAGVNDIIILDPKYDENFTAYNRLGIKVLNEIEQIEQAMEILVENMNKRIADKKSWKTLVIFDEFADATDRAKSGAALNIYENQPAKTKKVLVGQKKSLEENLKQLLQKGRSCGFRIVAATQRASVKVITGDAKANMPVQVCFRMQKEVDSKVVLDEAGAESLSGKGDGLIKSPEYSGIVRFQGFYVQPKLVTA